MHHLTARFQCQDKPPIAEPSNEEKLLAEIRDAMWAMGSLQLSGTTSGKNYGLS
jgi:hypothetical protein